VKAERLERIPSCRDAGGLIDPRRRARAYRGRFAGRPSTSFPPSIGLEQLLAVSGALLARSMFRDAGQIMDDDDDARRSQKFVLTIIRVIILVALISYAIWILLRAFASTKR